ncbi:MAG: cysteine synthase A [Desulfobacterales bacterium]|nr:cysteine synthase A [Desulfobacterales bacterium]
MKALNDITLTCGNTPLVFLEKPSKECGAQLYAKLEYFNPLSSVKDRIGLAMIEAGILNEQINQETLIVEPTSGNTGIALAFVSRVKGLKLVLTMPETMSLERRQLLTHLGAELVLTPGKLGMKGAIAEAKNIVETRENAFMPDQFSNPANPEIHRRTTGPEIWDDTQGKIDIFIAGVGTGGTITGVSEYIKQKKHDLMSIAVEPAASPVISGGEPGPHPIQGIGAGFVPKNLNKECLDEIILMEAEHALAGAKILARDCGLLCGISSGANFHAAFETGKKHPGKNIVFVACDTGERYISTDLFKS